MSSFKEEGYRVILVNSNPATIMTDKEIADKVYIEPLTHDFIARIIRKEQPDALLPTLGWSNRFKHGDSTTRKWCASR